MQPASWNAAVLSTACIALGTVMGILIGGGIAPPITAEPWLKTYQALLAALIGIAGAAAGLAIATRNVLRQMRINLISREEDRIERILPGLREFTFEFFYLDYGWAVGTLADARALIGYVEFKGYKRSMDVDAFINASAPLCPPDARASLTIGLRMFIKGAYRLDDAARRFLPPDFDPSTRLEDVAALSPIESIDEVTNAYTVFVNAQEHVLDEWKELKSLVGAFRKRLPLLRAELQRYFAE